MKIILFIKSATSFLFKKFIDYRFVTYGITTLFFVFIIARGSFNYIKPRNYTISKYYSEGGAMMTEWIKKSNVTFKNSPKQIEVLQLYNKLIRQRKTFHKSIVINLLTANEVLILISILCGSVSIIILTFIAGDGWKNVDSGYKSIFTTTTLLSILTFTIIKTYQLEENIAYNLSQYKIYDKIQLDILNNISTIGLITDNNPEVIKNKSFSNKCDSMVISINRKIHDATDVKVSVDLSKIKIIEMGNNNSDK